MTERQSSLGSVAKDDHDSNKSSTTIKVGSRKSQLALIQTNMVLNRIKEFYENNPLPRTHFRSEIDNELNFKVISMTTEGDRVLDKPLPDIGSKSLFTRDLEVALMKEQIDFIVHSLKDLPTTLPEGCAIGAIMKRDDPNDSIVIKQSLRSTFKPLDLLFGKCKDRTGKAIKIGTSSLRRVALIRRFNPNVECVDIRGNLNTRLRKLDDEDGEYSAIILARAGLDRMDWSDRCSSVLSPDEDPRLADWCYAVGQGAIAVECRRNDDEIKTLLAAVSDIKTTYEAEAERSLMKELNGGCSVPLGVRSTWQAEGSSSSLRLKCVILSADGETMLEAEETTIVYEESASVSETESNPDNEPSMTGVVLSDTILSRPYVKRNLAECSSLGMRLANKLKERGALELMKRSR